MMREYQPGNVTDGDGVRSWHDLTVSRDFPNGNGFKLWIGNYNRRHLTEQLIISRTINQVMAIMGPNGFFIPEIPPHTKHCGLYWLGISRFPHAKNWASITAKWSGWAHIVHWRDTDTLKELPSPNQTFELAREVLIETGYPKSLNDFSRTLISELSLEVRSKLIYESFPHLKNHQS